MNLQKLIFTKNACYKAGKKIKPKGIMVHSTGANNPNLRRYVGPDDGKLGENTNGNHWNRDPLSEQKCAHAFIGKLKDGSVATYQTLPWDHRGWHAGGSANDTHIGFEICEDGLADGAYFKKVYQEAVELCAYLCKMYGLTEKDIICHSEGYEKGLASNHGDVMHWFPNHGKSMNTFRADVKALLATPEKKEEESEVRYRVQVGSFSKPEYAEALLAKVKAAGFPDAFITTTGSQAAAKPEPAKPAAKPVTTFKVGDKVKLTKDATVYGETTKFKSWVYSSALYVREVSGARVVVSTVKTGPITGTVDKKHLVRA